MLVCARGQARQLHIQSDSPAGTTAAPHHVPARIQSLGSVPRIKEQQQGAIIENELHNNSESNVEVRGEAPDEVDPHADAEALHRKKVWLNYLCFIIVISR